MSCKFKSKFESKSREDQCPSTKLDRQRERILPYSEFLFNSGLQQLEWGPPTMGKADCFTRSRDGNVHLTWKHAHTHPQNNIDQTVGYPTVQSSRYIKLTITPWVESIIPSRQQGPWPVTQAKLYFLKSNSLKWIRERKTGTRNKIFLNVIVAQVIIRGTSSTTNTYRRLFNTRYSAKWMRCSYSYCSIV